MNRFTRHTFIVKRFELRKAVEEKRVRWASVKVNVHDLDVERSGEKVHVHHVVLDRFEQRRDLGLVEGDDFFKIVRALEEIGQEVVVRATVPLRHSLGTRKLVIFLMRVSFSFLVSFFLFSVLN